MMKRKGRDAEDLPDHVLILEEGLAISRTRVVAVGFPFSFETSFFYEPRKYTDSSFQVRS